MGIFHQDLSDVKKAFKKIDFEEAEKIVKEHIDREHRMDGTFGLLMRNIGEYQGDLGALRTALEVLVLKTTGKAKPIGIQSQKKAVLERLHNAQQNLSVIHACAIALARESKE